MSITIWNAVQKTAFPSLRRPLTRPFPMPSLMWKHIWTSRSRYSKWRRLPDIMSATLRGCSSPAWAFLPVSSSFRKKRKPQRSFWPLPICPSLPSQILSDSAASFIFRISSKNRPAWHRPPIAAYICAPIWNPENLIGLHNYKSPVHKKCSTGDFSITYIILSEIYKIVRSALFTLFTRSHNPLLLFLTKQTCDSCSQDLWKHHAQPHTVLPQNPRHDQQKDQ